MSKKYEAGLGCPHCKSTFYTLEERQSHITKRHPGQYAGATQDIKTAVAAMRRGGKKGPKLTPFEERTLGTAASADLFNDRRRERRRSR